MNAELPDFNLNMNLSLEQEFKIKSFESSLQKMNPEDMRSLLMEASKLLLVKDNIIKGLMKNNSAI
jgi:hypothetical protein